MAVSFVISAPPEALLSMLDASPVFVVILDVSIFFLAFLVSFAEPYRFFTVSIFEWGVWSPLQEAEKHTMAADKIYKLNRFIGLNYT